jgi:hypothetical protein
VNGMGVDFTGVVLVDERDRGGRRLAELNGEDVGWWRELRLDLVTSPGRLCSRTRPRGRHRLGPREQAPLGEARREERDLGADGRGGACRGGLLAATVRHRRTFTPRISLLEPLGRDRARVTYARRAGSRRRSGASRPSRGSRGTSPEFEADSVVPSRHRGLRASSARARDRRARRRGAQGTPITVGGDRIHARLERAVPFDDSERFPSTGRPRLGLALDTAALAENSAGWPSEARSSTPPGRSPAARAEPYCDGSSRR